MSSAIEKKDSYIWSLLFNFFYFEQIIKHSLQNYALL